MMMRRLEKAEQADTIRLLSSMGAVVYVLGTRRRQGDYPGTCQSPGLPDVLCFLREPGGLRRLLMLELKAKGGKLRPEQQTFRELCQAAKIDHVVGTCNEVVGWLTLNGYLA